MKSHCLSLPFSPRPRRRGVVTLEFILCLPFLLIIIFAVFEFGILLLVSQAVTSAAIEGSRHAAEFGAEPNNAISVNDAMKEFLAVHQIELDQSGSASGLGEAYLLIQYGEITIPDRTEVSNMSFEYGDSDLAVTPDLPGTNQVRVTVRTPVTDLAGVRPVPDWLEMFGFSIDGAIFDVRSTCLLE
ncbi:MAG: pilus assembly protein [Planctomycetaceae bacterium]|nr:pilus assembly protein [Planctomycetaceae bacterium]